MYLSGLLMSELNVCIFRSERTFSTILVESFFSVSMLPTLLTDSKVRTKSLLKLLRMVSVASYGINVI